MNKDIRAVGRNLNRVPLHSVVPRTVPFAIGIGPSDFCNFKCNYCFQSTEKGVRDPKILAFSDFKIIISQIEQLLKKGNDELKIIRFIGNGEPFLNKRIVDMVKYASERNLADRYEITTNGSLLTHELTDKLVDSGLTRLLISIQGVTKEKYKEVCGYDINLEKLVDEIDYFYHKSRGKCKLMVKTVNLSVKSQEERKKFFDMFEDISDEISIENVIDACEDVNYTTLLTEEEKNKTRYNTELKEKTCCDLLFMNMNVHANGDVDVCGCIYPPLFIGNVYKTSLAELWNGKYHKEIMIKHLTGKRNEINVCSKCKSITSYNALESDNLDPYLDEVLYKVENYNSRMGGEIKYGLIVYKEPHGGHTTRKEKGKFNIGDNIQMYAMKQIYAKMGVSENDIVKIDFHDLHTYDGEYVVLPINLFFFGCHDAKEKWFPASPKIIPVFIGVHFDSDYLDEEEVSYLNKYAPIGCRDEYTLCVMRKYNIPAYLFGCVTATLDKRRSNAQSMTYLVDVEDEVIDVIPTELKQNMCKVCHEQEEYFSEKTFNEMDSKAEKLIQDYKNNAALVITSRLHCASPCIAMGIPTIFIVKEKSSRFAWIDKLIPLYSINELTEIDWYPKVIDYEAIKKKMIDLCIYRITEAKRKWEKYYDISFFFENRKKGDYVNPNEKIINSIKSEVIEKGNKEYAIWGATALAEFVYQYLSSKYPHIKLKVFIDSYNKIDFHGIKSQVPEILKENKKIALIVTPSSAKKYIRQILNDFGYSGNCVFNDGDTFM